MIPYIKQLDDDGGDDDDDYLSIGLLMSVGAIILACIQGEHAFYVAVGVAFVFG